MNFDDDHLWGDWIDHDGKGCPLAPGTEVQVHGRTSDGRLVTGAVTVSTDYHRSPSSWVAEDFGRPNGDRRTGSVIRYRVRRYAAASKMIADAVTSAGGAQR